MFTYPTQKAHKVASSPSQKGQSPPKARPQSPYGLHRFSYTTNANTAPQTTLSRTPSPNKEFRKVSSVQSNRPASPALDGNMSEVQPRSVSPGSVRSLHTTNTFDTSVLSAASEGNVNRDLSKWFQTSTKDPKLSFLQSSLISVVKSSSRSSTPTRALSHNSSFPNSSSFNGASSVSMVSERLPLSTPHASSAWREQYQELGRDRVECFMGEDNIDYLGLAETELAAAQDTRSVHTGADSSIYDSNMSLEQRRNLKDAQDGIINGENETAGKGGTSAGGSRMMSDVEQAEYQAEEVHRRRQRRILQLVRDFCSTSAAANMSNNIFKDAESTTGSQSRYQLIVAAREALREAMRNYTTQLEQAATALGTYEYALSAQNTRYFTTQQQLLDTEVALAATGEENRELLGLVQEEFRRAADRVGTSALQDIIARYPQAWFPSEFGEGDGESVYSRQYNSAARPRTNSNMSMSELSTHTYNPHHTRYANKSVSPGVHMQYVNNAGPGSNSVMPGANTFSAPWVYNVNPAVATKLASNATTGHRYYGPPSTDRRATSPNSIYRTTNNSTGGHYTISESLSRPTSASRGRAVPIDQTQDQDDNQSRDGHSRSSSRNRSRSRERGRYVTINGPPPPPGTFSPPPRATSAERRAGNRSRSENDVSGTSGNRDIHMAISQLEASRQSLYASTASSHSRSKHTKHASDSDTVNNSKGNIYYQSAGPVSLLKAAADEHFLNNRTVDDRNNGTYTNEANYGTHVEGAKVRRGSNASLVSAVSNVSHLSVSTMQSANLSANLSANRRHPAQLADYTYTENNTESYNGGLRRTPSSSAVSHRLGQHTTSNTTVDPRYGIMRRNSAATESTDANYSGTRYSDYRFDDLHSTTGVNASTEPADSSEDYNNHNSNSTVYERSSGVKPSTKSYKVSSGNSIRSISSSGNTPSQSVHLHAPQPVSYATFDADSVSGADVNADSVIKGIRKPPPYYNTTNTTANANARTSSNPNSTNITNTSTRNTYAATSPNGNIDRSHISSSGSDTDDSAGQRRTQHNITLNGSGSTNQVKKSSSVAAAGAGNARGDGRSVGGSGVGGAVDRSNAKIFTFQNTVSYVSAMEDTNIDSKAGENSYVDDYYHTQYAPARSAPKQANTNNNNNNKPKSVPGWTLSKYKTDATSGSPTSGNRGSPTSGNRGRSSSGHVQSTQADVKAPQLYVYRGRPADTNANANSSTSANTSSVLVSPAATATKRSSSTTSIRRGATPKVPVPVVVEYPANREALPFQNATQADMANYIESMRKMRY